MKKTITRIFAIAALIVVIGVGANAQSGRFSLGAELGLPLGSFGDGAGIGFGGTLRYEHPIGDNMGLTGTAGYLMFSGKDQTIDLFPGIIPATTIEGSSVGMIPIQAGFKYYFNEAQDGFYAMAEIGVHMASVSAPDYEDPFTGETIEGESSSSTNLSYAPSIGYHLANLDLGLRYQLFSQKVSDTYVDPFTGLPVTTEATSTSGYIGLRIAYVFGEK